MNVKTQFMWLLGLLAIVSTFSVAAEQADFDGERYWSSIAQNTSNDLSTRLEAMQNLSPYSGANTLITVARASRDLQPEMRVSAIRIANHWEDVARWDVISPLLNDEDLQVKKAAVRSLLPLRPQLNEQQQKYLDAQIESFLAQSASIASFDIVELHIASGDYQSAKNMLKQLESQEQSAARIALLNSEMLLREGEKQQALNYLNKKSEELTDNAPLYYQIGMILVSDKRYVDAENALSKAHSVDPEQPRYLIALATLVQRDSPERAISMFEELYQKTGRPEHLYSECYSRLKSGLSVDNCMSKLTRVAPHFALTEFEKVQ